MHRWHRAHVASSFGVGAVALEDGVPVGFVLGSTDRRAHVAWLLAHRRRELVLAGALALATRPAVLAEFLRTRAGRYARRLLRRAPRGTAAPATAGQAVDGPGGDRGAGRGDGPVAVLEAVVVVPGARTRGIGTRLTAVVVDAAREAGADRVELVTKAGQGGAAGFYERGGWQRVGSHVDRDGDEVHTFRLPLTAHWTA
ncbi:GNAT family N-acetyltransferase [Nocardioides perillae]|uniref:GNAT superfamily N-acetyltransferase n=1 Tax=Nocardioides perillae TaxID=1119534 RepID=A0A7Y9RRI1_9ACTN|nr:GNAT superfamily N-acetyltransferase [Nocardioides perillae]